MWRKAKNRFHRIIFQDDNNYVNANYEVFLNLFILK